MRYCAKRVYSAREFGGHACPRKGVVEWGGKWWCKQHDPVAEKARSDERSRRYEEERRERDRKSKIARDLIDALGFGRIHYEDFEPTGGVVLTAEEAKRLVDRLRDLER